MKSSGALEEENFKFGSSDFSSNGEVLLRVVLKSPTIPDQNVYTRWKNYSEIVCAKIIYENISESPSAVIQLLLNVLTSCISDAKRIRRTCSFETRQSDFVSDHL